MIKRWVYAADIHGIYYDASALKMFYRFMKEWKPEIRICGGDVFDFTPLRRQADEKDLSVSILDDIDAGFEFLHRFKPQHYLLGNHEDRLYQMLNHPIALKRDMAGSCVRDIESACKKMGCKIYPYHKFQGVVRIGHLKAIHGFNAGVYATRQTAQVYGSCIMGHVHAIDSFTIPGLSQRTAYSSGCLCKLDMEYAKAKPNTLKWEHGWIYGIIDTVSGDYHVIQARQINNKWYLPMSFKRI